MKSGEGVLLFHIESMGTDSCRHSLDSLCACSINPDVKVCVSREELSYQSFSFKISDM